MAGLGCYVIRDIRMLAVVRSGGDRPSWSADELGVPDEAWRYDLFQRAAKVLLLDDQRVLSIAPYWHSSEEFTASTINRSYHGRKRYQMKISW